MYKILYIRPISREVKKNTLEKTTDTPTLLTGYLDVIYYSEQLPVMAHGTLQFTEAIKKSKVFLSGDFIVQQLDKKQYDEEIASAQQTQ